MTDAANAIRWISDQSQTNLKSLAVPGVNGQSSSRILTSRKSRSPVESLIDTSLLLTHDPDGRCTSPLYPGRHTDEPVVCLRSQAGSSFLKFPLMGILSKDNEYRDADVSTPYILASDISAPSCLQVSETRPLAYRSQRPYCDRPVQEDAMAVWSKQRAPCARLRVVVVPHHITCHD